MDIESVIKLLEGVKECCRYEEDGSAEHICEYVTSKECADAIAYLKTLKK